MHSALRTAPPFLPLLLVQSGRREPGRAWPSSPNHKHEVLCFPPLFKKLQNPFSTHYNYQIITVYVVHYSPFTKQQIDTIIKAYHFIPYEAGRPDIREPAAPSQTFSRTRKGGDPVQILTGKSILDQFAFGPLCFYRRRSFHPEPESRLTPEEETHRFHTAQRQAILQLSALYDSACAELGTQAASIFSIHAMLLEDASLVEEVLTTIRSRHATAEYAVQAVEREFSSAFAGMDSPYMRARGADIRDIAHRVIRCLLGLKTPDPLATRSGILVSDELLPSEVLALDRRKLLGLVTRRGSVDSHTAMLLRLMKIPGLAEVEISSQDEGHAALLDGFSHSLYLDPEPQLMAELGLSPATARRPLAASL